MPARRLTRRFLEPPQGATRRLPVGPARGIRFEAQPGLSLDFWLGLYESELAPWLRRLCRTGTRCVDVGAYNAYYALTFAKLTQERVLAYEPDSDAIARGRRNLALNPTLAPLIELRSATVGARNDGAAVTLDAELVPRAQHIRSTPWLLKVDAEGAEHDVLKGAAGFLAMVRPHVVVETHSPGLEAACGDALLEVGYSPTVVTQRRLLPQDRTWPPGTPTQNRWLVAVGR